MALVSDRSLVALEDTVRSHQDIYGAAIRAAGEAFAREKRGYATRIRQVIDRLGTVEAIYDAAKDARQDLRILATDLEREP